MSTIDKLREFKASARGLSPAEKRAVFASPEFQSLVDAANADTAATAAAGCRRHCYGHCNSHCVSHCIAHKPAME